MSYTITTAMVEQYSAAVIMLAQQKDTRLQKACQIASVVGKSFYAERLGSSEMHERTSRHADIPLSEDEHTRRKGTIHDMVSRKLIDRADTEKIIIDPQGKYVQNSVAAANRAKDMWILRALGGVAHSGEAGATSVNNYDAGECRIIQGDGTIATAGSDASDTTQTALTYTKVLTAKNLLDAAEIDSDRKRYLVTNSYNINQLLLDTTLTGEEMKEVRNIRDGKVGMLLGFEFIQIEYRATGTGLLYHTVDAACIRSYAFAEGAITFGIGGDIRTVIERVPEKDADQILCTLEVGAERNEGPAVVEMLLKAAA
jgi:hypothetical protein